MTPTQKKYRTTRSSAKPRSKKIPRREMEPAQLLRRIDLLIRELEQVRQQLAIVAMPTTHLGLTQSLYGAAGRGARAEYDLELDWQRFGEWQMR